MDQRLSSVLPMTCIRELIGTWLKEDIPNFDIAAITISNNAKEGIIVVKEQCVLAGVPFITEVFSQLHCSVEWKVDEGTKVSSVPSEIATVRGPVIQILQGERLALNILSRACGIATYAKKLVDIATTNKWKGSVVGTRKTTPGFRLVEKYAMLVGGAGFHRYDVSSMVMIKDNHIDASSMSDKEKGISQAITQARKLAGHHMKIEVESRNEKEALASAAAGADIVLLDNFNAKVACSVAQKLKARYPRLLIEASGNINESNISGYMGSGIDILSTSRLCSGYSVIDASMKLHDAISLSQQICGEDSPKTVNAGIKRTMSWASGGKTAVNDNVNKNGDSAQVDLDEDLPGKRRKTDDVETLKIESPKNSKPQAVSNQYKAQNQPTESATVSMKSEIPTGPKVTGKVIVPTQKGPLTSTTSLSGSDKQSSLVCSVPVTTKPSPATNSRPSVSTVIKPNTATPVSKPNAPSNRPATTQKSNTNSRAFGIQWGNNRPDLSQNRGNNRGNYNQNNRYNRLEIDNNRYRQNDRYQNTSQSIQRPQPPQPVGRGIVGTLPGSAGPLHQQLALHAAANRAGGMPVRPGNSLDIMVRHGSNPHQGRGSHFNSGGRPVTGSNPLPSNGPRNADFPGRLKNMRDWEYRY